MASPFEIANEEYIEELKSRNENTKNNTEWLKNVFKKWVNLERNLQANLEEYENDVLDQRLSHFQLSIQNFSNFSLYVINEQSQMDPRKIKD